MTSIKYDLLVRLSKYPPREEVTPEENFFTEAFAGLLEYYREERLAPYLFGKLGLPISWRDGYTIQTQFTQRDESDSSKFGRFDLIIEGTSPEIVMENKVESRLSREQLDAYKPKDWKDRIVVGITKYPVDFRESPELGLYLRRWSQVYKCVEKFKPQDNFLLSCFLRFMEEKGMKSRMAITRDGIDVIKRFVPVKKSLQDLLNDLVSRIFVATFELKKAGRLIQDSDDDGTWYMYAPALEGNGFNCAPGFICDVGDVTLKPGLFVWVLDKASQSKVLAQFKNIPDFLDFKWGGWLVKWFTPSDEFLCLDAEKQEDELASFYRENLKLLADHGLIELRKS